MLRLHTALITLAFSAGIAMAEQAHGTFTGNDDGKCFGLFVVEGRGVRLEGTFGFALQFASSAAILEFNDVDKLIGNKTIGPGSSIGFTDLEIKMDDDISIHGPLDDPLRVKFDVDGEIMFLAE